MDDTKSCLHGFPLYSLLAITKLAVDRDSRNRRGNEMVRADFFYAASRRGG
jgi:hypothetical protein